MLDINLIRDNPQYVKMQLARRRDVVDVDAIVAADVRRREIIGLVEALRQQRNTSSKQIGHWMGTLRKLEQELNRAQSGPESNLEKSALQTQLNAMQFNVDTAKADTRQLGEELAGLELELQQVEKELREAMLWVPNLPSESTPDGRDETENVIHKAQGAPLPTFDFQPIPHWDLGPQLDIIDFERGVKLSGTRFYLLKGLGARLQRAVIHFMLDYHVREHGYLEIYPPYIVRSAMFEAAGQLPKYYDNIYRDAEEDFMLLGTAEIALTNVHRDEILDEDQLPLKYVAYTACFRREKMSAGRDVRGIKRGHQFDKVEMYQFTRPEESYSVLEELKQQAIDICEALGFHYRVVELSTGDIGFAATKTYDIEIWAAGCDEWLEVSSASNCTDFQARRANVRYRPTSGGRNRIVHTLNASGLALPRVMIALMENNQQQDGSIVIPEVLRPYMGGETVITPR